MNFLNRFSAVSDACGEVRTSAGVHPQCKKIFTRKHQTLGEHSQIVEEDVQFWRKIIMADVHFQFNKTINFRTYAIEKPQEIQKMPLQNVSHCLVRSLSQTVTAHQKRYDKQCFHFNYLMKMYPFQRDGSVIQSIFDEKICFL